MELTPEVFDDFKVNERDLETLSEVLSDYLAKNSESLSADNKAYVQGLLDRVEEALRDW